MSDRGKLYWAAKRIYRIIRPMFSRSSREFAENLKEVAGFDRIHNTDFGGRITQYELGFSENIGNDYSPSPDYIGELCDENHISSADSIMDMGCGKGYAMYWFGKYPANRIVGVDISSELCSICRGNLEKIYPNDNRFEVFQCDITKAEKDITLRNTIDECNYFYIYNSFPFHVMRGVVEMLVNSIIRNKRKIVIWYVYPEAREFFDKSDMFKLRKQYHADKTRGGVFEYESVL